MKMNKVILTSLLTAAFSLTQAAEVQKADSLDQLLNIVKNAERVE